MRRHVGHGGQVQVLAGEQEEVHAAALGHAVFRQLLVHTFLRLEQELQETEETFSVPDFIKSLKATFSEAFCLIYKKSRSLQFDADKCVFYCSRSKNVQALLYSSPNRAPHLLLVGADQLLVVPVLQFAGSLRCGHGGVKDEKLPAAFCCLQEAKR